MREIRKKLTITLLSSTWTDVACSPPLHGDAEGGRCTPARCRRKEGQMAHPCWGMGFPASPQQRTQCCLLPRFKPELWVVRWRESHSHSPSGRKGDSEHCLGVCLPDSLPFRVFCRGIRKVSGWDTPTHVCTTLLPCQTTPTTDGNYSESQAPPGHMHVLGAGLAVREPGIP